MKLRGWLKAKWVGSDPVYKVGFPDLYFMYACILVILTSYECVFVFFSSGGCKGVHSECLGHILTSFLACR